jgi:colicin import membrane protein
MSERRIQGAKRNKTIAYIGAALVHVLILGAMVFNFTSKHESIDAAYAEKVDVVKATTIDESQIKKQQDKLKKADAAKKRREAQERKRLEDLRKKSADEEKQIEDLKKQQKLEKEKTKELELERKEIALKKQQELEKAKKDKEKRARDAKERKRKEKLAADKKKKEREQQEELERIETEERELLAAQDMQRLIDEEEAMLASQVAEQRTVTAIQKYFALIGRRIGSVRTVDPSFEIWRKSTVDIKVSPSGDVQYVRTIESSGSKRYDDSVESAVYKASPLPMPDIRELPEANRRLSSESFEFEVKHPSASK